MFWLIVPSYQDFVNFYQDDADHGQSVCKWFISMKLIVIWDKNAIELMIRHGESIRVVVDFIIGMRFLFSFHFWLQSFAPGMLDKGAAQNGGFHDHEEIE